MIGFIAECSQITNRGRGGTVPQLPLNRAQLAAFVEQDAGVQMSDGVIAEGPDARFSADVPHKMRSGPKRFAGVVVRAGAVIQNGEDPFCFLINNQDKPCFRRWNGIGSVLNAT